MTKWEDSTYEIVLRASGPLGQPTNYKFKMQKNVASDDAVFYNMVINQGSNATPIHPFTGGVLVPQSGKPLIHYLPKTQRLNPDGSSTYKAAVEILVDEIVGSKIEAEPDKFERLVGYIAINNQPVNLLTFYRVTNVHSGGQLLVIGILNTVGASPGGSIGVIGR
jgi:hypothetical protein